MPTTKAKVSPSATRKGVSDLYLAYAIEDLRIINNAMQMLNDCSRVTPTLIAGTLHEERANLLDDPQYAAAAVLIWQGRDQAHLDKVYQDMMGTKE